MVQTTILLGILTITSLLITVSLGIARHYFHKPVLRYHLFFAFLTSILAVVHAILVISKFYF